MLEIHVIILWLRFCWWTGTHAFPGLLCSSPITTQLMHNFPSSGAEVGVSLDMHKRPLEWEVEKVMNSRPKLQEPCRAEDRKAELK